MIKLEINDRPVTVGEGVTILDAAEKAGERIPTLCHIKGLFPSGACRMCVVGLEGRPGLVPACSFPAAEGMKVHTRSPRVLNARKTILELLLASHPFECWSDAVLPGGLYAVQQPAIRPLYDTHGLLDALVAWGSAAGAGGGLAAAASRTVAPEGAADDAINPSGAYHYVRGQWAPMLGHPVDSPAFEEAWNERLRAGYLKARTIPEPLRLSAAAAAALGKPSAPFS